MNIIKFNIIQDKKKTSRYPFISYHSIFIETTHKFTTKQEAEAFLYEFEKVVNFSIREILSISADLYNMWIYLFLDGFSNMANFGNIQDCIIKMHSDHSKTRAYYCFRLLRLALDDCFSICGHLHTYSKDKRLNTDKMRLEALRARLDAINRLIFPYIEPEPKHIKKAR